MEQRTKILIVDDEPINLDFFDVMLSNLGFVVEKAQDGEEALEKVKSTRPDLVLLDNIMPKLSGWEVTRTLKTSEEYEDYRDIPIVMFSAMDDVRDKVEGFELGIDDYIIKPFNFSEVLARIRAVLRHRTLAQQVIQKERKIALIESLNKSLVYFIRHLKAPVEQMAGRAQELDVGDRKRVSDFRSLVIQETEEVLAAIGGLEDEIRELERKSSAADETAGLKLQNLEEKFQEHFGALKKGNQKAAR